MSSLVKVAVCGLDLKVCSSTHNMLVLYFKISLSFSGSD